ncbi:MAG TPA: UDP-glucose 4-epimerase GalE [Candidatus Saccharimonadales bacterium]|nr:UDP-glucose 4-epimerase GalE [Candidatus Saccharimonadales bacterium]
MKILVTGGAGYIGSVVTTQLVEAGHEVIVVDKAARKAKDFLPESVKLIDADITEVGELLTKADGIEAVLHFAALIAAGESMQKPELYWQNNTIGSIALIKALRELEIKKLIFSSTAAVYGNPKHIPITEETEKDPTNTYGMTKLAVDMAITSECWAHGLAATSLRYFNVAGAYNKCGERHAVETHIIPLAFDAAVNGRPFQLFGDDYPTDDGTCVRDYIHVADLARAHLLALENLQPGAHSIYNLGNGRGFSNKQVIDTVEKVTGRKLTVEMRPRREGDPAILVASSEKAYKELEWIPQKPELDTIIADAWDFYQRSLLSS